MKFLTLIVCVLFGHSLANIKIIEKFVVDFIKNERIPTVLTIRACWTQEEKAHFLTATPTRVQFVDKLKFVPHDDFANKILFFVDMNCPDSVDFLHQVIQTSVNSVDSDLWFLLQVNKTYFSHPFHWIFFDVKETQISELNVLELLTDSYVVLVSKISSSNVFDLQQSEAQNLFFSFD